MEILKIQELCSEFTSGRFVSTVIVTILNDLNDIEQKIGIVGKNTLELMAVEVLKKGDTYSHETNCKELLSVAKNSNLNSLQKAAIYHKGNGKT